MAGKTRVFLDSSILIAGLHSEKGGSGTILKLIKTKKLVGFISLSVIEETKRNIRKKLSLKLLPKLEKLTKVLSIQENFDPKDIFRYRRLVDIKDLHVLVFASSSKVDYLITLDIRHLKTEKLRRSKLPFKIAIPKEFLEDRRAFGKGI